MKTLSEKYKSKLRDNAEDSYEQYLAKSGINSRGIYLDSLAEAKADTEILKATSRSLGEGLSSKGLSNSGYAEHLSDMLMKEQIKKNDRASEKFAASEYKNLSGYEKYLSDYDKLQEKIAESVINDFSESGSFSLEDAYKRAVFAGANELYAMHIAGRAREKSINRAMDKVRAFAKTYSLSAAKAKKYAKSLGLPDSYAEKIYKEIAGYNEQMKEYFTEMTPEQYYNYIQSQK